MGPRSRGETRILNDGEFKAEALGAQAGFAGAPRAVGSKEERREKTVDGGWRGLSF